MEPEKLVRRVFLLIPPKENLPVFRKRFFMKKIYLLFAVIVSALLACTFCPVEIDAQEAAGTITIENPVENQTYEAWQILSINDNGTYSAADGWKSFIDSVQTVADENGQITAITNEEAQELASAALDYARTNSIAAADTQTAASADPLVLTGLEPGYYLVHSSTGSINALVLANPSASIQEKNAVPTLLLQVMENNNWQSTSSASIGSSVQYKATITPAAGAENYVLNLSFDSGLSFESISEISLNGKSLIGTDYTLKEDAASGTVTLSFMPSFLSSLSDQDSIVIAFSAMLNKNALIDGLSAGNSVRASLSFGSDGNASTDTSKVTVWTYRVQVAVTNSNNCLISGAVFSLWQAGNRIALVANSDGTYRIADPTETDTVTTFTSATGLTTISGIGAGDYYLQEISAPQGYTAVTGDIDFTMQTQNNWCSTQSASSGDILWTKGGVHVINRKAVNLPITGSEETFFLYAAAIVMAAAGFWILWTSKKHS